MAQHGTDIDGRADAEDPSLGCRIMRAPVD